MFYPVARATVPNTEDIALESLEEHHIVKWVLSELADLDPERRAFRCQGHRAHRERPSPRRGGGAASSSRRCATSSAARCSPISAMPWPRRRSRRRRIRTPVCPTSRRATPLVERSPESIDCVGDNLSGIAQGSITAWQDLIARILGTDKPKVSPTGSTIARKRAKSVRRAVSTATDGAEETVDSVRSGAATTARTARRVPRPRRRRRGSRRSRHEVERPSGRRRRPDGQREPPRSDRPPRRSGQRRRPPLPRPARADRPAHSPRYSGGPFGPPNRQAVGCRSTRRARVSHRRRAHHREIRGPRGPPGEAWGHRHPRPRR